MPPLYLAAAWGTYAATVAIISLLLRLFTHRGRVYVYLGIGTMNTQGKVAVGNLVLIGIALLLEFTDTSVRTPQDIVRYLSIPILGVVPDVDDEEVDIKTALRSGCSQEDIKELFRKTISSKPERHHAEMLQKGAELLHPMSAIGG